MKKSLIINILASLLVLALIVGVLMLVGLPYSHVKGSSLIVEGFLSTRIEIPLSNIKSLELAEDFSKGEKITGIIGAFGTCGVYRNAEEDYYLFAWNKTRHLMVLDTGEVRIVFNCSSQQKTENLYDDLSEMIKD